MPLDGTNLALRAAVLVAERVGIDDGVHLHLRKGIPVAGGMAGGSADAAAALVACDALWRAGLSREDLHLLAAELGSDVPFALLGGTAIGTGRGERAHAGAGARRVPLGRRARRPRALDPRGLRARSTGCGRRTTSPSRRSRTRSCRRCARGDAPALGEALANDLQAAAFSLDPALERTLAVGYQAGALGGVVSGSGPSVVFLAAGPEHALDVAVALTASGVAAGVRRAHGPVAGRPDRRAGPGPLSRAG